MRDSKFSQVLLPPWSLLASPTTIETAKTLTVHAWCLNPDSLFAIVSRTTDPDSFRTVSILNGASLCSHPYSSLNSQLCSHAIAALMKCFEIEPEATLNVLRALLTVNKMAKEPPYIKTHLLGWNSLVKGMPLKSLFGLFGTPAANKSILAYQLAWPFLPYSNALVVDTEGGAGDYAILEWIASFNKRFETKIEVVHIEFDTDTATFKFDPPTTKKEGVFFVLDVRDIVNVLKLHGYKVRIDISPPTKTIKKVCPKCKQELRMRNPPYKCPTCSVEAELIEETDGGGKLTMRYDTEALPKTMPAFEIGDVKKTPIGKLVLENNIKYIVYDSITNPTEIYISGQLNFPDRDNANGLWFQQIQSLASRCNVTAVGIFHLSTNPTSIYDAYGHPIGGKAVGHNFKFVALLRRLKGATGTPFSTKPEKINKRKLFMMRHPSKAPFAESVTFDMSDEGLKDSPTEGMDDQ